MEKGIILKGIGGFYYLETEGGETVEAKPRGIFRKDNKKPLPGDFCMISKTDDGHFVIEEILPRRNHFDRPTVANIDALYIVASMIEPAINLEVLDRLIAICEYKDVEVYVVFTKLDLKEDEKIIAVYRNAGFDVFLIDYESGDFLEEFNKSIRGKTIAFAGNSGVGKSTLMNYLMPELSIETAGISQKLGRGRHTTREVMLYKIAGGGYLADTPGFSSLEIERAGITAPELSFFYREMRAFLNDCQFNDCRHIAERNCAVKAAVDNGDISKSRYETYKTTFALLNEIKEWK